MPCDPISQKSVLLLRLPVDPGARLGVPAMFLNLSASGSLHFFQTNPKSTTIFPGGTGLPFLVATPVTFACATNFSSGSLKMY